MKYLLVLTVAIAVVQGGSYRVRRQGWGWSPPATTTTLPPTTTAGWSPPETTVGWSVPTAPPTTAPPTTLPPTTGWPAPPPPPPTNAPGWPAPPPPPTNAPGWPATPPVGSSAVIIEGGLAALAGGWAASNHGENIQATGGGNVPAAVAVSTAGDANVDQYGNVIQLGNIDSNGASGVQSISVDQAADASEGLAVIASGLAASIASTGWSGAAGQGASSASGSDTVIIS